MKIKIHCFAEGIKIKPDAVNFYHNGYAVSLVNYPDRQGNDKKRVMLSMIKKITEEEVKRITTREEPVDHTKMLDFLNDLYKNYILDIVEISQLVEGLITVNYGYAPTKFNTVKPIINLIDETAEEEDFLLTDGVPRGFGFIDMPDQIPEYLLKPEVFDSLNLASTNLPALSFFAQATRSYQNNDLEISFFLNFRILEGYFSDGTKNVEGALIRNETDLARYLDYDASIINSVSSILTELKLSSKCSKNFEGLIKDIVLLRHKFTHFSSEHSKHHYSNKMKNELDNLIIYMRRACAFKLMDEIGIKRKSQLPHA